MNFCSGIIFNEKSSKSKETLILLSDDSTDKSSVLSTSVALIVILLEPPSLISTSEIGSSSGKSLIGLMVIDMVASEDSPLLLELLGF